MILHDFECEPRYRSYSNLNHPQNPLEIQQKQFKYIEPSRFSHKTDGKTKSYKNFPDGFFLNV